MNTALIKELRQRTGVGFGDCKKALVEADWDMDRAVDVVRRQSGAKAAKKADRKAAEGLLGLDVDGTRGVMVEVNVETDFAARNPKFAAFVERAVAVALEGGPDGVSGALEDERRTLIQEIGENVSVRRAARMEAPAGGVVAGYLHQDRKKAALVALAGGEASLARDIAMHVTAMRPLVLAAEDLPADMVAKERTIFEDRAAGSGKPPQIVEKMVTGQLRKFVAESSLLEQPFVKDTSGKTKVGRLLDRAKAACIGFERFEVGEGIDKGEQNFADEVRKQLA